MKEVNELIRDKAKKILRLSYNGKRLNAACDWHKLRNPFLMSARGAIGELIKKLPPSNFKNFSYRVLFRIKIGRDVVLGYNVFLDPLFPELLTFEDGAIIGSRSAILAHEFLLDSVRLGKVLVKEKAVIGGNCTIRSGTAIGKGAVIANSSFVNRDVKENEFVGGVPITTLNPIDQKIIKWNNFGDFLDKRAEEFKNKTYLTYLINNQKISYKNFNENCNKIASYLIKNNIKKGNKVATLMTNSPELLYIFFGALKIGAVATPINFNLAKEEITYLLKDSEARIVFCDKEFYKKIDKNIFKKLKIIKNDKYLGKIFKNKASKIFVGRVSLDDEAFILYTSGTTDKPKGVVLTHKNILIESFGVCNSMGFNKNDVMWCILSLYHTANLLKMVTAPLFVGASTIITKGFSKSRFWEIAEKYGITSANVVPTIIAMLLNPPEDISKRKIKLSSIIVGGSPLSPDLVKKFEAVFKVKIIEGYGLSEVSGFSSFNPPEKRKIGSVGIPMKINQMQVFDKSFELYPYQKGEIVIKGPNVMKGYLKKYNETKKTIKKGWLYSGDIGYKDEEGYFYYVDRKKDMIIRGGENISPTEIEKAILKNKKVQDVAVIGIPDKIYGEEIKAFIVKKDQSLTEEELINFCKRNIAIFKCPKSVEFISHIPRSGLSQKILRRKLQEMENDRRK